MMTKDQEVFVFNKPKINNNFHTAHAFKQYDTMPFTKTEDEFNFINLIIIEWVDLLHRLY